MDMEYPKVLLVTSSTFNSCTGTGILLTNLFKGWPIDKIAMVHSDSFPSNDNVCKLFYKLGGTEIKFAWPLSKIYRHLLNNSHRDGSLPCGNNKSPENIAFLAAKTKSLYVFASNIFGSGEVFYKCMISDKLEEWINTFKPNIIYSHIYSLNDILFVRQLKSLLKIPLAIHIMDDWFRVKYRMGLFSPILRFRYLRGFKKLLGETSLRMGISAEMCQAYEKRYGYSFVPFCNPVDCAVWLKYRTKGNDRKDTFQIVYAGTINTKNVVNLQKISKVVKRLHSQRLNIQLKIYTFQPNIEIYRSRLERKPSVIIKEVPNHDKDMAFLLSDADLLFLPVDFTKRSITRIRYSMFAKIPAYMISGTPTLVNGPAEVAAVEYALKEKWAYVVPKKDPKALKEAILELMSNSRLRSRLGQRAQELAIRDFDTSRIRKEFRMKLAQAAFGHE